MSRTKANMSVDQPNPRTAGRVGGEPASNRPRCAFCRAELAAVHEFVYQVESLNFLDDPAALEILRRLPTYHGEPLRLCGDCRGSIEANIRDQENEDAADARAGVLAWRLVLWLLVVPLGMLFALAAVVEIVNRVR